MIETSNIGRETRLVRLMMWSKWLEILEIELSLSLSHLESRLQPEIDSMSVRLNACAFMELVLRESPYASNHVKLDGKVTCATFQSKARTSETKESLKSPQLV
jgi:hypothetical protein